MLHKTGVSSDTMTIELNLELSNPFLKQAEEFNVRDKTSVEANESECFHCCKKFFHYKKECIKLYLIILILLLQFSNLVYSRLDSEMTQNFQNKILKKVISKVFKSGLNNLPGSSHEINSTSFEEIDLSNTQPHP